MGLETFLSNDAIYFHKEYLNACMLRYSVMEKSFPFIVGMDIKEIAKKKMKESDKNEIITLKADIMAHQLYFSSFGEKNQYSKRVASMRGGISSFLYSIYEKGMCLSRGFLLICENDRETFLYENENFSKAFVCHKVKLAIDLCEHAYFLDYGFDKSGYLKAAISHLNIGALG